MNRKLALIAAAGLVSSAAMAEYAATFEDIDSDRDGYISAAEAKVRPALAEVFAAADANKDGKLNIDEFVAYESAGRFTPPEESEVAEIGAAPTE